MDVTTLEVRIPPSSEITKHLATRRDAMRAGREQMRRLRVQVRTAELEAHRVPAARELALFIARRDSVAQFAASGELEAADAALRHAIRTGTLTKLHDTIGRLEHGVERSWMARNHQLLVLDQVARRLPRWLCIEAVVRGCDNVLRMYARLDDGREVVIAARENAAEEHAQTLDVTVTSGSSDRVASESDVEMLAVALCKHLCSEGMDVAPDPEALTEPDAAAESYGGRERVLELRLAISGLTMSAAGFPTEWRFGEYAGIVLTALAIGMALARHLRG